jgi:hypothetical protein
MDRHYQLKVTSNTTNIDVDSVDADEVARIVQLAGLKGGPVETPMAAPISMPNATPPVADPIPAPGDATDATDAIDSVDVSADSELDEEVAEFDHGHDPKLGTGEEVDPDSYIWDADRLPQHFGKTGDNTLNDPITEAARSIYKNLSKAYKTFIAEEARENDDGIMSPLSDPDISEFDKDPLSGQPVVDDGSHSPMSTVKRQPALK